MTGTAIHSGDVDARAVVVDDDLGQYRIETKLGLPKRPLPSHIQAPLEAFLRGDKAMVAELRPRWVTVLTTVSAPAGKIQFVDPGLVVGAVAMSALQNGWSPGEIIGVFEEWIGSGSNPDRRRQTVEGAVDRALERVVASPAGMPETDNRRLALAWYGAVLVHGGFGRCKSSVLATAAALLDVACRNDKLTVHFGHGQAALDGGRAEPTAGKSLRLLCEERWLELVEPARGGHPNLYRLRFPGDSEDCGVQPSKNLPEFIRAIGGTPQIPEFRQSHPLWGTGGLAGGYPRLVLLVYVAHPGMTRADAFRASGGFCPQSTFYKNTDKLLELRILLKEGMGYRFNDDIDLDLLAQELGATGRAGLKRERNRQRKAELPAVVLLQAQGWVDGAWKQAGGSDDNCPIRAVAKDAAWDAVTEELVSIPEAGRRVHRYADRGLPPLWPEGDWVVGTTAKAMRNLDLVIWGIWGRAGGEGEPPLRVHSVEEILDLSSGALVGIKEGLISLYDQGGNRC